MKEGRARLTLWAVDLLDSRQEPAVFHTMPQPSSPGDLTIESGRLKREGQEGRQDALLLGCVQEAGMELRSTGPSSGRARLQQLEYAEGRTTFSTAYRNAPRLLSAL